MQFDEGAEFLHAHGFQAAVADAVERFADADTGRILAAQNIACSVIAGIGRRGHRRRCEARAFFVGPGHDLDGAQRRLAARHHRLDRLERGENSEHAVEPAAGRLRVDMRAGDDGLKCRIAAFVAQEEIGNAVRERLEADRASPGDQLRPRIGFGRRQRRPVDAAVIARAEARKRHVPRPEALAVDEIRDATIHDATVSVRAHDLRRIGARIARAPSSGFDLGDKFAEEVVEQFGFLQIQRVA
jgi:hypothetical protein